MVIDPPNLPPVASSEVFVQSEFYPGKDGGIPTTTQLLAANPDLVTFNGYANQYQHSPIHVHAGQRVRWWVLDAGPSEPDVFHVVGAQFDTVYKEGAYLLQPGGAADGAAAGLDPPARRQRARGDGLHRRRPLRNRRSAPAQGTRDQWPYRGPGRPAIVGGPVWM